MRKIDKRLPAAARLATGLVARAPTLTLPYEERCKSRLAATLDTGEEVALLLPRGTVLRDADVLVADDGALVRVVAAPQAVLCVSAPCAPGAAGQALLLLRAAYHLGNRHIPVEIGEACLKLEADPVLAQMLMQLGLRVEHAELPFAPEAGAYGGGHRHGHDSTFTEDYAIAQELFAEHHGAAAPEHGHEHGHGQPHEHPHDDGTCTHPAHSHAHR